MEPVRQGMFHIADVPGLGLELNDREITVHPYIRNSFPTLWDKGWYEEFSSNHRSAGTGS
jgi:hypothetical protein